MADRSFGSDDMVAEYAQDRRDADVEEHGWRCEKNCGFVTGDETAFMYHECDEED